MVGSIAFVLFLVEAAGRQDLYTLFDRVSGSNTSEVSCPVVLPLECAVLCVSKACRSYATAVSDAKKTSCYTDPNMEDLPSGPWDLYRGEKD